MVLDDVCITVHIQRQDRKIDAYCNDVAVIRGGDSDAPLRTFQPLSDNFASIPYLPTRLDSGFYSSPADEDENLEIVGNEPIYFVENGATADNVDQDEHAFEELNCGSSSMRSSLLAHHTSLPRHGHDRLVNAQDLLGAIDAALRHAIFEAPFRRSSSTVVKRDTMAQKLAAVMPSMWSPGYLAAIGSRAVLIPTISHALANFSRTRAKYFKFRDRNGISGNPSTTPSQANLSTMLWQKLQSRLYNPRASRRIKSFLLSRDGNEKDVSTQDELLDLDTIRCYGLEDHEHENHNIDEDLFASDIWSNDFLERSSSHSTDLTLLRSIDPNSSTLWASTGTENPSKVSPTGEQFAVEDNLEDNLLDQDDLLSLQDELLSVCGSLGSVVLDNDNDDMLATWEVDEDVYFAGDQILDVTINPSSDMLSCHDCGPDDMLVV